MAADRQAVGVWTEWPKGIRWANEGMTRLLGFLLEGAAESGKYVFRIVLHDSVRDIAQQDLEGIAAKAGRDYTLHSPRDHSFSAKSFADLADYANAHVPVAGWLSLYPHFSQVERLDGPVAVVFPDAIPVAFPEFGDLAWGKEGRHRQWQEDVRTALDRAGRAVTFSDHVATAHGQGIFGFDRSRIDVATHASPDLKSQLPYLTGRRRTKASRSKSANLLRDYYRARTDQPYLRDFPFEEVDFIAVSTQDRVTKNIQLAARAMLTLIRERRIDTKLIMTAPLHFNHQWTVLPSVVEQLQATADVVSSPDLPRQEHAALLHCASVVVHPSLFEGGHAPFPFYEAVSVGTPALMANGPHIDELAETEPGIREFCFDWDDRDGLADRIVQAIDGRDEMVAAQLAIFERLKGRGWAEVSDAYARAALTAADDLAEG